MITSRCQVQPTLLHLKQLKDRKLFSLCVFFKRVVKIKLNHEKLTALLSKYLLSMK